MKWPSFFFILEKEKLRHSKVKYKFLFHKVSSPPSPSSLLKLPNKPIWWLTWKHVLGERSKFLATISFYGACSEDILVQTGQSESGYHRIRVDGWIRFEYATCGRGNFWIRREKVADSKISGYVWTRPKKTTTATETSLNKRFNEQNNACARAFKFLVDFFAVLCKTTTWNNSTLFGERERWRLVFLCLFQMFRPVWGSISWWFWR